MYVCSNVKLGRKLETLKNDVLFAFYTSPIPDDEDHRTLIEATETGSRTQPQPQKISLFKPKKKFGNNETWKLDPGPHFRDCISETAFPGPQSRDHENWDCVYGTAFPRSRESGLHFKYHGSGITFFQLQKQDYIFDIMKPGLYFQYHGSRHR